MSIKRLKRFLALTVCVIGIVVFSASLSRAQERGLGYSEAPFELVENAVTQARGNTALAAVQAASADTKPIELDQIVVESDYAFMTVTYNYIGVSAVSRRQDGEWRFVCRAGGLMQTEELTDRCSVPESLAPSLYSNLVEVLSNNVQR